MKIGTPNVRKLEHNVRKLCPAHQKVAVQSVRQLKIFSSRLGWITYFDTPYTILSYVRILSDLIIHFADPNLNYALNKPTTQKTYPSDGRKAVDGNRDPLWSGGSCTGTDPRITDPQWWRVDFGEEIPVSRVQITSRIQCCPERLSNFAIKIGNSLDNDGLSNPKCAGDNLSVLPAGSTKEFACKPLILGRYLAVQSYVADVLTLCEVEVYAYP